MYCPANFCYIDRFHSAQNVYRTFIHLRQDVLRKQAVWLYYRLSRDEDDELNSLRNQRSIIESYAISNGHEIIGESFDDNIRGMHFEREGIAKIYEVVDAGKIDAIVVKDLSRLGRHRVQTELFIEYLRENNVRVLSATEGIDIFNEKNA